MSLGPLNELHRGEEAKTNDPYGFVTNRPKDPRHRIAQTSLNGACHHSKRLERQPAHRDQENRKTARKRKSRAPDFLTACGRSSEAGKNDVTML